MSRRSRTVPLKFLAAGMSEDGVVDVVSEFREGDEARITEGPFAGLVSVLKKALPGGRGRGWTAE